MPILNRDIKTKASELSLAVEQIVTQSAYNFFPVVTKL